MGNNILYTGPEIIIPESVDIAMARAHVLPHGTRLFVIPASQYEVVRFSFVFKAGTSWQQVPFSASATVNTLSEGSANMTSHQLAEKLDFYGSYFDVNIDRDWSVVTFVCLAKFFPETLKLAREILLYPLFPEEEIKVYCVKSKQNLTINRKKVDFNAREIFARSLYGNKHPYGSSSPAGAYDTLTSGDLRSFYEKHYTARNCFVVMSGDVTDERREAVSALVADMREGEELTRNGFPQPVSIPSEFKEFPEALQSAIRIGRVLFPRSHPDYIGMQVLTTVLGGYFGSRLVQNLREQHGYTYGAYSAMVNFDRSGYMAIATEVGSQFTEDAVAQIFHEIARLRSEPVPESELALVKNIMVGEVMRILDGPFGIADVTIENVQNNMDNNYVNDMIEAVRAITPGRLLELAVKYMQESDFTTVVAGRGK